MFHAECSAEFHGTETPTVVDPFQLQLLESVIVVTA